MLSCVARPSTLKCPTVLNVLNAKAGRIDVPLAVLVSFLKERFLKERFDLSFEVKRNCDNRNHLEFDREIKEQRFHGGKAR